MRGEELKMFKLIVKREDMEELNKLKLVIGVPSLIGDLLPMGIFTK